MKEKDFDSDLITDETYSLMVAKLKECGWTGENPYVLAQGLFTSVQLGTTLTDTQTKMLSILVFFSFMEKISLILEAFENYVRPQIKEVVSLQKNVERGILDFEAKLVGVDGVVICDNKTASRDYDENSVKLSVQLASYQAKKACYIVFNKSVRKNKTKTCSVCGQNGTGTRFKTCNNESSGNRCGGAWTETVSPEIIPQILIDEISDHVRGIVNESFVEVEKQIEAKAFPRNLNACGKQYGKPCVYLDACWNNDKRNLEIVPEEKTNEESYEE